VIGCSEPRTVGAHCAVSWFAVNKSFIGMRVFRTGFSIGFSLYCEQTLSVGLTLNRQLALIIITITRRLGVYDGDLQGDKCPGEDVRSRRTATVHWPGWVALSLNSMHMYVMNTTTKCRYGLRARRAGRAAAPGSGVASTGCRRRGPAIARMEGDPYSDRRSSSSFSSMTHHVLLLT